MLPSILIGLALIALLGVIFEEKTHVNKAKVTLFFGTLSWVLLFVFSTPGDERSLVLESLNENVADIAGLWIFLVAAMTFVAYLNKKGMIETLIYLVLPARISERALLFLTALFCFVFSSLADNITATLVSITLILSLRLDAAKTVKFATLVVFAVNSGGVALITGDVTTLMIFLAGKVKILQLLALALPAFAAVMLLAFMLSVGMNGEVTVTKKRTEVRGVDVAIALIFLGTILSTIAGNFFFQIPPVLTFLTGLSIMFLVARFFNEDNDTDPILEYVRQVEFETLFFFLGILLLVGMLKEIQVLDGLVRIYDMIPAVAANYLMGVLSAAIDNVPLTAALLKSGLDMGTAEWMVLTYAVGVGGSLLVIGSAAGIVAMSKVPGLTFGTYLKYFLFLFIAFNCGFAGVYMLGRLMAAG
ncbi:sodium:proton antiporter NhaD [Stutzerimonas azotifigens]|uniref:Sodium:proton antiporter n=1 Tax=Stutzerimonas azotifigens TaxID=291995 RepID=A0ABR5YXC0_9GAMM|nr:sodium:proton antiporter NhaD [Stutzerimonas azotifigens]MBA1272588.1 sodium:proton antiporter [Stutzerimonas azotifigens]